MKKLSLLISLSLFAFIKNANGRCFSARQKLDTVIFYSTEHPPEFPGGAGKFASYLAKNIKYPKRSLNEVQGRIIVQMVIEKNGCISRIKMNGVKSKELELEIYKTLINSPKWIPATQNNKPVRFNYVFPIACILPSTD